jgi:hypothetical protein
MKSIRKSYCAALLCVASVFVCEQAVAHVPGDFDGDGVSDVTTVFEGNGRELTWRARFSTTQQVTDIGVLGTSGDLPVMASWLGSGTQIGVVAEKRNSDALVWTILANGSRTERVFGKVGDLVVSGGDFNGDGIADAAVVRLINGRAVWQVLRNPFKDQSAETLSITFGQAGDRAFFARVDGTAQDWIGVIRKGAGRNSQARMRNIVTGETRTFTRLPAFATQGDRPRPFPVRQPGAPDLLAFHQVKGRSTAVRVFTQAGVEVGNVLFDGVTEGAIGEFNTDPGYELAFQAEGEAGAFNPQVGVVQQMAPIEGTLADTIAYKTVGGAAAGGPGQVPAGGTGGAAGGAVAQCNRMAPWPSSYIYKTIGSDHFTDVRRNTIGLILKIGAPGPYPSSCVRVLASNGKVITSLGLYARGAGWAARYYSGIGCGAATPVNGAAVSSLARQASGSSQIIMNMDGTCYGPIESSRCYNSSSC